MSSITAFCEWLLRRSTVWGGMACFAFYAIVVRQLDHGGQLFRLFAGDSPRVKALVAFLFFIGAAKLTLKLVSAIRQFGALEGSWSGYLLFEDNGRDDIQSFITQLDQLPHSAQLGYLPRRLRAALDVVQQLGAGALPTHLSLLAENDRQALRASYDGVRAVTAAMVFAGLFGLLGVVAATLAATSRTGSALASFVPAGLAMLDIVYECTFAVLAIVFARLAVENFERRLLAAVDSAAARQLLHRFHLPNNARDAYSLPVIKLCERVLQTVETAVGRHDAALSKALSSASRRWEEAASTSAALLHRTIGEGLTAGLKEHAQAMNEGLSKQLFNLETGLTRHAEVLSENVDRHATALADALEHHTAVMADTETNLAAENRRQLAELEGALGEAVLVAVTRQEKLIKQSENLLRDMQAALLESAGSAVAQQEQLARQGDVLLKVVEATGQVRRLEEALNGNLAALAGSHHFEETVVGLSAALQLLSANLGRPTALRDEISLTVKQAVSQAA